MSKFRITIEEVHEDGTVTPFTDENGNTHVIPEHEGFLLIGITDEGETFGATTAIQNLNAIQIAEALSHTEALRHACRLVSVLDFMKGKGALDDTEDEDAAD